MLYYNHIEYVVNFQLDFHLTQLFLAMSSFGGIYIYSGTLILQ